ncbi:MAG TPA: DMT family transporter [Candidatus Paceibacterota bacterium]|nr:DMT family transporter [Candidatus Paceibacterota bacterium]
MLWILVITLAYLCFALSSLGDRIILSGHSRPNSYTFFVGILSAAVILLIPFIGISVPQGILWLWIILAALFNILGIYTMFSALNVFDVSKIIPTIGALQPIFVVIFSFLILGEDAMGSRQILAFVILLLGSVLISIEKNYRVTRRSLKLSFFAALFFSLEMIFAKIVYLNLAFWDGFIWMKIFGLVFVMSFLFNKTFRSDIFNVDQKLDKKNSIIFFLGQGFGGLANILQGWAISLVPLAYLGIMNAMKGLQYVFLFIFALIISAVFPKLLNEKTSKTIIIQRIIAIILIVIGLLVLFL